MRGNSHVRCGVGENSEITSKSYLSLKDLCITSDGKKYENLKTIKKYEPVVFAALPDVSHIFLCSLDFRISFHPK